MKTLFFVFCLLGSTYTLTAQSGEGKITLSGIVIDAQTLTPLPYATISRNYVQGTATDENGKFTIQVNPDDTIEITYVGYQKHLLQHQEKENKYFFIYMEPMVSMLQEIEILFFPAGQEFKKNILALEPTKQHIHALNNIAIARLYAEAVTQPPDHPFSFHPYLYQPSGFTLFSSKSRQGITRFIRSASILHNHSTYFHLKPYQKTDENLIRKAIMTNAKDSVHMLPQDTLLTKETLNHK